MGYLRGRSRGDVAIKTTTAQAPWTIVAGNDKRSARVQVLKTVVNPARLRTARQRLAGGHGHAAAHRRATPIPDSAKVEALRLALRSRYSAWLGFTAQEDVPAVPLRRPTPFTGHTRYSPALPNLLRPVSCTAHRGRPDSSKNHSGGALRRPRRRPPAGIRVSD